MKSVSRLIPRLLLAAQILILILALLPVVRFTPEEIPLAFAKWECTGRYDEGWGFSAEGSESDAFLTSPELSLDKGSYLLTVEYESDDDQTLRLTDNNNYGLVLPEGVMRLSRTAKAATIRCELSAAVPSLTLQAAYSGEGEYCISSIRLTTDNAVQRRNLLILIAVFLLIDFFVFSRRFTDDPFSILFVLGIALAASLPLMMDKMTDGHDCAFHLMRIEAIADGLSRGIFPLHLSALHLDGWGYPTSIFYGDLLLYLPALLRLVGFSVTGAYKAYVFTINLLTAAVAYACFVRIGGRKRGAVMTAAYCLAGYRLMDIYVRMAVGEYSAMLFLPLIACGLWDLIVNEKPSRFACAADVLLLAFGFAGLACTHILSTEITIAAVILCCLAVLPRILRPRIPFSLACAAVLSLLLAAIFIVPLLDYMKNVPVSILSVPNPNAMRIQVEGAHVSQLFSFFASPFGGEGYNTPAGRFALTPGIVPMAAVCAGLFLLLSRKGSRHTNILTLLSVLMLFLSTDLFPWDMIEESPLQMLTSIQFPWRWLSAALVILVLLAGEIMDHPRIAARQSEIAALSVGLMLLSACIFTGQVQKEGSYIEPYDRSEIILSDDEVGGGEYMRFSPENMRVADDERDALTVEVLSYDMDWLEITERNGLSFTLDAMASMDHDGIVELPVFNYKGMTARSASGDILPVCDGENCRLRITVPAGYDGKITVSFEEPAPWRVASFISLAALVLCLGAAVKLLLTPKVTL